MIHVLHGILLAKSPNDLVISCGGVGFYVMIPNSVYADLPEIGGEATVYTYLNVKEDGMELYGFEDEVQQSAFKMLISVSGVGPKAALAILSLYHADHIAIAVAAGDYKAFTACSGIGPKIAQRIVLELKDKVKGLGSVDAARITASEVAAPVGAGAEALAALVSLGFSNSEAATAISKLPQNLTTEELISAALKSMAR